MKFYVIEQINATGNGSFKKVVLVTNPRIEGNAIHATKVGEVDWYSYDYDSGKYIFQKVVPADFFIIGNATCEEITDPFGEE